jgi:membrane-bound lytic murein transglycosylase D
MRQIAIWGIFFTFISTFLLGTTRAEQLEQYLNLGEIEQNVSVWKKIYFDSSTGQTFYLDSKRFEFVSKSSEEHIFKLKGQKSHILRVYRKGQKYFPMMEKMAVDKGLSPKLTRLILLESGARPMVVSPKGATGLWQLMAPAANEMGLQMNAMVDDRYHPVLATMAALQVLKNYQRGLKKWPLAITAYNFGYGNVSRGITQENVFQNINQFNYETKNYFYKLMALLENEEELIDGLDQSVSVLDIEYSQITLPFSFPYGQFKRFFKNKFHFNNLTSHLKGLVTKSGYNIPQGTRLFVRLEMREEFNKLLKKRSDDLKKNGFLPFYKVESGDGLLYIAKKTKTSTSDLKWINGLKNSNLRIGQKIYHSPKKYTVENGDTLNSLAESYSVDKEKIQKMNLLPRRSLKAGVILDIP